MLLLLLPMMLGDAALDAREFDEHYDEIAAAAAAAADADEVLHDDTGAAAHDKRIDEVVAVEDSRS